MAGRWRGGAGSPGGLRRLSYQGELTAQAGTRQENRQKYFCRSDTLRQALEVFRRIGVAEAADIAAELDAPPDTAGPALAALT
jgi:hypothetical protein